MRLALVVAAVALLGVAASNPPATLPDGTYRYAVELGGSPIGNTVVVVRHAGQTIEIDENANVAGQSLTTTRTLDAKTFATRSYDVRTGGRNVSLAIAGNTAKLTAGDKTETIATPNGVPFVVMENMAAGFLTVAPLILTTGSQKFTIACVCVTGFVAVPAQVTTATRGGLTLAIRDQSLTLRYDPSTNVLQQLDIPAQKFTLTLQSQDAGVAAPHAAPQPTPLPLDPSNYTSRDVTVVADDGVKLAATLTLPATDGPFPGVLLVHGSGCIDRDETIGPNKVFAQLANHLSNAGYAVLRYDKRSCGKSGGTFPVRDRLIADARDALAFLRAQKEIDAKRIYVLGHSEGGELAPSIAIADKHLRGIVLLAPPALPLEKILMQQLLRNVPARQQPPARRKIANWFADIESGKAKSQEARWLRSTFGIDPIRLIARVPCPILVLQGTKDIQVLPDDTPRLVAAARAAHRDLTEVMLDGDDHLFIKLGADAQSTGGEYFVPSYLDPRLFTAILDWLSAH